MNEAANNEVTGSILNIEQKEWNDKKYAVISLSDGEKYADWCGYHKDFKPGETIKLFWKLNAKKTSRMVYGIVNPSKDDNPYKGKVKVKKTEEKTIEEQEIGPNYDRIRRGFRNALMMMTSTIENKGIFEKPVTEAQIKESDILAKIMISAQIGLNK